LKVLHWLCLMVRMSMGTWWGLWVSGSMVMRLLNTGTSYMVSRACFMTEESIFPACFRDTPAAYSMAMRASKA